jgi:hypothetical protein
MSVKNILNVPINEYPFEVNVGRFDDVSDARDNPVMWQMVIVLFMLISTCVISLLVIKGVFI